jgi:hypothetical protein
MYITHHLESKASTPYTLTLHRNLEAEEVKRSNVTYSRDLIREIARGTDLVAPNFQQPDRFPFSFVPPCLFAIGWSTLAPEEHQLETSSSCGSLLLSALMIADTT